MVSEPSATWGVCTERVSVGPGVVWAVPVSQATREPSMLTSSRMHVKGRTPRLRGAVKRCFSRRRTAIRPVRSSVEK